MNIKEFTVSISYSQIVVFDPTLEPPFNMWTAEHVAQGFSWRPGSAAFATLDESGKHPVTVCLDQGAPDAPSSAARIIEVPFAVPASNTVEIGGLVDSAVVDLPSGLYRLRYECYAAGGVSGPTVRLSFSRDTSPHFCVVRADGALSPGCDLIVIAEPA